MKELKVASAAKLSNFFVALKKLQNRNNRIMFTVTFMK